MNLDSMEFILEIICQKKIKDREYVINLDEYADVGTRWIALYVKDNKIIYFDNFERVLSRVEHVPKEI